MSNTKARARAVVSVTLEIDVGGGEWGADCTVEQVEKQAREAAEGALRQGLIINGLVVRSVTPTAVATIVGEPLVKMIIYSPKGGR